MNPKYLKFFLLTALTAAAVWVAFTLYNRFRFPPLPLSQTTLINEKGETVAADGFQTPYVLVSYFQSWCSDCLREAPSIAALKQTSGGRVSVLMISDEPWEKINPFRARAGADLPFFQSATPLKQLGIYSYPTTYLLGPDRKVLLEKQEGYDWNSPEVQALTGNEKSP